MRRHFPHGVIHIREGNPFIRPQEIIICRDRYAASKSLDSARPPAKQTGPLMRQG